MSETAVESVRPISTGRLEFLLGALYAVAPISIDMYLPAMPTIARELGSSATLLQLTLSAFFVGFALGQFGTGPLIDRFGRKRPLLVGLALFALASVGCALVDSAEWLIAFRFLQALGGSIAVVVPRAVVRDLHSGIESARMLSRLMLVMGVGPILSPLLGGYLLSAYGWRSIFLALALAGVGLFFWSLRSLPSYTSAAKAREGFGLAVRALLSERDFVRFALVGGFAQAAMFAYIAGSSFAFIDEHGLSPGHYSLTFGINAAGLILCAQINRRLLLRTSAKVILRRASFVAFGAGSALLFTTTQGVGGAFGLEACLFVFVSCVGFIGPNSTSLALERHGARAGVASSLLGSGQFSLAAAASAAVGALGAWGAVAMGAVVALATGLSFACGRERS